MAEARATLDTLLADAGGGATRRWFPGVAGAKLVGKLATRPWKVARRGAGYGGELAKIAIGQSEVAPSKKDRRFKDDAWHGNPAFRRLAQVYLAAGKTVDDLISDAGLDERSERRVRFSAVGLSTGKFVGASASRMFSAAKRTRRSARSSSPASQIRSSTVLPAAR